MNLPTAPNGDALADSVRLAEHWGQRGKVLLTSVLLIFDEQNGQRMIHLFAGMTA